MRCVMRGAGSVAIVRVLGLTMAAWLVCASGIASAGNVADWSEQQIPKLPKSEKAVKLFNGKDLTGWEGQTEKYFSVADGIIVAKNTAENAPKASTYLVTKKKYRNFRLIFESKLAASEMHSGIALWGQTVEKAGDPYSYMGHLVMYPSGYGFYDLYRRNSIYQDKDGVAKKAGRQHDWNRMEIWAVGSRIRHVINGQLVADWTDPKPELCQEGPIGLQLHSNSVPQEVQFRGLVLTENPADALVTVEEQKEGAAVDEKAIEALGFDAKKLALIPERMNDFVKVEKTSGVVALVARQGKVVHLSAVGEADIDTHRRMTADTLFAIASMTKPITATALMILVEEGKVSLDDPASKYVPEFADVSLESGAPKRPILVRDLVTHTSGLAGQQANEGTLAETAVAMAKRKLAFQPGDKWQYGPGLSIVGRVIEVASEKPYEDFLAERIFKPLGMTSTTFFPTEEQRKKLARLYKPGPEGKGLAPGEHFLLDFSGTRTPNPSGGLFSTAADLARFYQMILNGGELDGKRVVSKKSVEQMTRIQTGELVTGFTPGNGWGLGWCVVREPQGVTKMLSSGTYGHGGAFGTQGWVDPQRQMIYVLLVQRTGFPNSDGSDIRDTFQQTAVEAVRPTP